MVPINVLKYIKIILYTQWTPTCFGQPCGHFQRQYSWRRPHGWPEHAGVNSAYTL